MNYGLLDVLSAEGEQIFTVHGNPCSPCAHETEHVNLWSIPSICKQGTFEYGLAPLRSAEGELVLSAQGEPIYSNDKPCERSKQQDDTICDPGMRV